MRIVWMAGALVAAAAAGAFAQSSAPGDFCGPKGARWCDILDVGTDVPKEAGAGAHGAVIRDRAALVAWRDRFRKSRAETWTAEMLDGTNFENSYLVALVTALKRFESVPVIWLRQPFYCSERITRFIPEAVWSEPCRERPGLQAVAELKLGPGENGTIAEMDSDDPRCLEAAGGASGLRARQYLTPQLSCQRKWIVIRVHYPTGVTGLQGIRWKETPVLFWAAGPDGSYLRIGP